VYLHGIKIPEEETPGKDVVTFQTVNAVECVVESGGRPIE
jgi:hypothetical protein